MTPTELRTHADNIDRLGTETIERGEMHGGGLLKTAALFLSARADAVEAASEAEALREQLEAANAKAEPEHPDFKHQSPRVAIEVWNKQLRNALGLLTHNEHPSNETADAVGDVLHLVSVLREQVEALRRERDEARATTILAVSGVSAVDALKAMTAERDEWKAKADAAVSRVAALEAALREVERVAEDWRHPDKLRNMADADVIAGNALSGGTSALDVHDAALREEIAREVESHAEDVDSMHWRQAHRIIAQRIVAGADVLATIRAKGGK